VSTRPTSGAFFHGEVPNQAARGGVGQSVTTRVRRGCVVASPGPSRSHARRDGALTYTGKRAYNGIQVDQGGARKAKQKPEGEMEGTKTAAASEAL